MAQQWVGKTRKEKRHSHTIHITYYTIVFKVCSAHMHYTTKKRMNKTHVHIATRSIHRDILQKYSPKLCGSSIHASATLLWSSLARLLTHSPIRFIHSLALAFTQSIRCTHNIAFQCVLEWMCLCHFCVVVVVVASAAAYFFIRFWVSLWRDCTYAHSAFLFRQRHTFAYALKWAVFTRCCENKQNEEWNGIRLSSRNWFTKMVF